jgi:hypothetical protein
VALFADFGCIDSNSEVGASDVALDFFPMTAD